MSAIETLIQQKLEEVQALQRLQTNPDFQRLLGQKQFAQMLNLGAPQDIVSILPAKIEDRLPKKEFKDGELVLPSAPEKPTLNNAPSGTNRRLKQRVAKKPVKERDLLPEERSEIIALMNKRQDLLPHDDGVGDGICQKMCDKFIRKNPRLDKVYPYQISGYYSHLCRMAMKPAVERAGWFTAACTLEKVLPSVPPVFGKAFIKKVTENWERVKNDEVTMHRDHFLMLNERKQKGLVK
jgi:hypothetical protein